MFAIALLIWLDAPWWVWIAAVWSMSFDFFLAVKLHRMMKRWQ
jgi:hypothetical protein